MNTKSILIALLVCLAALPQAGCILPPECDINSDDFDQEDCNAILLLYIRWMTETAYGEWEPPPPVADPSQCIALPCRNGPCRYALENGNFEQEFGLGLKDFIGGANTEVACVDEGGAHLENSDRTSSQFIDLQELLTPGELRELDRIRVRARVWFNAEHETSTSGLIRLEARNGDSQGTILLAREAPLTTDADSSTWQQVDVSITPPEDTETILFQVASTSPNLFFDYAQVAIDHGNRAPTAHDLEAIFAEDTPWAFVPHVIEPDGVVNPLSLQTSEPEHGTLINQLYTPNPNYFGPDAFTYSIADEQGFFSNEATVRLTIIPVNDAPEADDDSYTVPDGGLLLVPEGIGVLANDTDVEGDTLTAMLVDDVENGTLTFEGHGGFSYTPDNGFVGTDTFTYRAFDRTDSSAVATVSLTSEDNGYDLSIEKTASATSVQQGSAVTFTIRVTNNGPGDATGVRVRDRMTQFTFELDTVQESQGTFVFSNNTATGTWTVGALDAGETATLTLRGFPGANMTNTATIIDGLGAGDDDDNNEDQVSVTVQ